MEDLRNYINQLRHDFSKMSLDEHQVEKHPIIQFEKWFKDAVDAHLPDPNAFVLSTASASGRPSSRVLLLRNFSEKGFVFYTNYQSRKGEELRTNPYAAMNFFWPELERQVRIEGVIEQQNSEESDVYFKLRPDGSKLGAWTSPQSKVINSREELESHYQKTSEQFDGKEIPRPSFWGGYLLKADKIEFWQGRPSRLHDRLLFTYQDSNWKMERLAP
jgi:pyridoxamine 5'-phosphate oxidase